MNDCIIPGCHRPQSSYRGLCMVCYSKARKYVELNHTTWEKLEAQGLALPATDPFTKAFDDAKKKEVK